MGNCGTGNTLGVGGKGVTATVGYAFDSGFSMAGGISSVQDNILTDEGSDLYALNAAYIADSYGVAIAYATADNAASDETTYWGVNGYYTPDSLSLPSISLGFETEETGSAGDKTGYFVGLTWAEVGPGSVSVGLGTTANFLDTDQEYLTYEASYSYPVNDFITITPGAYITETAPVHGYDDDEVGVILKSSFAF